MPCDTWSTTRLAAESLDSRIAMLASSSSEILNRLSTTDLVLDVGGWAKPFPRADWVLDFLPYETRGLYGYEPSDADRFSSESWTQRDICDHVPWPFDNHQFDFAICSHTLEDVRDPVWVCNELIRVAKAGYIEVPSRLEEQTYGVHGPWVGWSHHHWFIDVTPDRIDFVFKSHAVHAWRNAQLPAQFCDSLLPAQRVQMLWWDGGFDAAERIFVSREETERYLVGFVESHSEVGRQRRGGRRLRGGLRRALGR